MSKFKRLANTLPSFYKAETNTIIRGLLESWAIGDDEIEVQVKNTKDQIFIQDAEGRYLDFLGNNVGVPRNPSLGMGDDDFRKLVPVLSFQPKQVRKTIIALLDVFWGPGFTRSNVNSGNIETFNFGPESLLTGTVNFIKGDTRVIGTGTTFLTELVPGDYIKASTGSGVTYQKVSAVLSNTELVLANNWASTIALNSLVSKGVIRKLSYKADNLTEKTIRFKPNAFAQITSVKAKEIADYINKDSEHSKYISGSVYLDPQTGSKLNIRTNTPGLLGAIQITGGDANTPDRLNFTLSRQADVKASVFEINPNEIVVRIPSSVPVLRRTLRGAVHPKKTKTEIFSGNEVYNFSGIGASSTLNITVDGTPHVVTFTHSSAFANAAKVTAEEVVSVINKQLVFLEAFTGGAIGYKKVGLRTTEGSAEYQVTGGTANTVLNFVTTLQQDPDLIVETYPSAYLFDPTGQLYTVTGINTNLTSIVASGSVNTAISLTNAANFPNKPGKLIFNFGRSEQEGPIVYNSRPNNSTLLIDASHIFNNEHVVGRKVNLISDSPTIPRLTGADYPVYVVGTEQARQAAQSLIKQLLAAGVVIRFIIAFPEVLFECVCRSCGPAQIPDLRGSMTGSSPLVF